MTPPLSICFTPHIGRQFLRGAFHKERQWNFPQQSRGVPRRGEPAVRQPSPLASERQSGVTGFRLSSSALLPQTLGLYRQARGFCEGLSIVAPITLKVKSSCAIVAPITLKVKLSCTFIVTGVYGDHALSTCMEIKRANQKL